MNYHGWDTYTCRRWGTGQMWLVSFLINAACQSCSFFPLLGTSFPLLRGMLLLLIMHLGHTVIFPHVALLHSRLWFNFNLPIIISYIVPSICIISSLDWLYFWHYQFRSNGSFKIDKKTSLNLISKMFQSKFSMQNIPYKSLCKVILF